AYPVFIGGGYGTGYVDPSDYGGDAPVPMVAPQAAPPMVYPPPQQEARPVIIQMGPDGQYTTQQRRPPQSFQQAEPPAEPESETPHYLIAFKDHTIYSSVAYWVDGDTLHYFTNGSTHNQASMSLIDRDLTERLNREMGNDFRLPAAK